MMVPKPWGGRSDIDVLFLTEHSLVTHSLHSVVSFCANHHALHKETFLVQFESCTYLWVERYEFRGKL